MNQEQIWELVAPHWKTYRTKLSEEIVEFLQKKQGRVLDLGSGTGRNLYHKKGITWYAVDFSKSMVNYTKEKAKKIGIPITIKKREAHKTGFPNNYFDAIILHRVLHCINTTTKREQTLKEIYRVLKPKGQALISTWGPHSPRIKGRTGNIKLPWTYKGKKLPRYTYIYTLEELTTQLKKIGFEILNVLESKRITIIIKKPISKED